PAQPAEVRDYVEQSLSEWFNRDLGRWARAVLDEGSSPEQCDWEIDDFIGLLLGLEENLGIPGRLLRTDPRLTNVIRTRAADHPGAGRLDQADRTVAALMVQARGLVRESPHDPWAHEMLAEAFQQRAKNAWKRQDIGEIRRELARAVEAREKAVSLD